jgi:hypothetical protein
VSLNQREGFVPNALGRSALGIALLCSRQVGRAYDKKYGPGDDNADD